MKKAVAILASLVLSGCADYKFPANLTPQTGASVTGVFVHGSGWAPELTVCIQKIDDTTMMYHGWGASDCSYPVLFPPGPHKLIMQAYLMKGELVGNVSVNANFVAGEAYSILTHNDFVPLNNGNGQMSAPQNPGTTVWIESESGSLATQKVQISFAPFWGQNETQMLTMAPILMMK